MGLFRIIIIFSIIYLFFSFIENNKKIIKRSYFMKKIRLYEKIQKFKYHIIILLIVLYELLF